MCSFFLCDTLVAKNELREQQRGRESDADVVMQAPKPEKGRGSLNICRDTHLVRASEGSKLQGIAENVL